MCGINGILFKVNISNLDNRIIEMNKSIAHRGPDAGDIFLTENIALGHRRLSIIDIRETANQPMHSNSGAWHIVFNGEIYNFKEIRRELRHQFKTESDTEVIVAAVEERGIKWFIDVANGMFAIALYNSIDNRLFLIRDRMGIKPLYYYNDGDKLVFSSEIKGILASGLVKAEFNELAVDEYLGNRYVREPYTFFKNVYQVESGTYLELDKSLNAEKHRYWDIPSEFNIDEDFDEEVIAELFEAQLTQAINYRLLSDVPLGTYLSGGVDSSLITAVTAMSKKSSLNTYTIGFPELNEFAYSKVVSEQYNTTHHEILMMKEDYVNNWERLIGFKDAPLGVPNEIPLAVMSTKLKDKVTVVLSGEGADELMGGYGKIFRLPFDFKNHNKDSVFYKFLIDHYEYVSRDIRDKLLSTPKNYREEFDDKILKEFSGKINEENVFRFFHKYHVKGLLQRVDMTTMQTSVEARVPFLDHNLIDFVYSKVPYSLKLKWNSDESKHRAANITSDIYSEELDTPKYLIRKIAYKYMPNALVDRKKMGFPVPLTEWFDNLEEIAKKLLPDASWLKPGAVDNLVAMSKEDIRAGQVLWMFINLEMFRKKYFSRDWEW